jgi:hypothetical protein
MDVTRVTHVTLAGGGLRGVSYLGALTAIATETDYATFVKQLTCVVGTSIGALFALGLVLELPLTSLKCLLTHDGRPQTWMLPELSFQSMAGMDSGESLERMVRVLLAQRRLQDTITLGELNRFTNKDLVVVCTDSMTGKPTYLSAKSSSRMLVKHAVAASMRVPLVYAPLVHDGMVLTDGGTCDNFALSQIPPGLDAGHVLGLKSTCTPSTMPWPPDLKACVMRTLLIPIAALEKLQYSLVPVQYRSRVIDIDTTPIQGTEVYAGPAICRHLWTQGYFGAMERIHPLQCKRMRIVSMLFMALLWPKSKLY